MKLKTLLFVSILFVSTLSVDAQIKNWINKQKKKIVPTVQQLDPRKYVKRKINENFYLNKHVNNISYKYSQLKTTLYNNVNLYNNTNSIFRNGFYTTKYTNNQLTYLEKGLINKRHPVSIKYNNIGNYLAGIQK